MKEKVAVVVTSIAGPGNEVLQGLARGCRERGHDFIVIGDRASPPGFELEGCRFYDLERQRATGLKFAQLCPEKHYARKNIGYLLAAREGVTQIVETDDDNIPYPAFWEPRRRVHRLPLVRGTGWLNVYGYFTDSVIWPRGLPLNHIRSPLAAFESLPVLEADCPIQQGLADENPDVDAIFRLIHPQPESFRKDRKLALGEGAWSPGNSQNTTWWAEAFPLLYLPAFCSFRMTDIWRSFVAQRVAWAHGWSMLFHEPTVWQKRNEHDLMKDFRDEVPGYLHNAAIGEALGALTLERGVDRIGDHLMICYEKLVGLGVVDRRELELLGAWLEDLGNC